MSDLVTLIERGPQGRRMQIGRYEVFEEIASGASGFVLRAFDPIFRWPCALKVPHPNVLADPEKRRRFLKDARALGRLGHPALHPNVVRVYDADECGGICYIAMELCEEGSLAGWLDKLSEGSVIPAYWAAHLVKQIAAGVQHAHDRGIYHRDLKPANVLLTLAEDDPTEGQSYEVSSAFPRYCPKVADFGLAKILGDGESTVVGALIGTRPYMAPEQVRCDSAAVGPATDVWALGVILYELLTRRRPFEGPTEAAILKRVCEADPTPPRRLRPDLPRGLETVCLKCLEERPGDRYRSPSELANDLQRILEKVDPLGRRPPLWRQVGKRAKRHPVPSALLGVLLGVAALALPVVSWNINFVRQKNIEGLFHEVGAAQIEDVARLVSRFDESRDATVIDQLGRLFEAGRPVPQLIAAAVLAPQRPECRQFCHDRLLDAEPREIGQIARVLEARVPGLVSRLGAEVDRPSSSVGPDREAPDRRRANAASALILLGSRERGWPLLKSSPDPQARTFLIHRLGPAGLEPGCILDRIKDRALDPSIRMALIQALARAPDVVREDVRARAIRLLLDIYRDDPDAGVHGSAKWLLLEWHQSAEVERIDGILRGEIPSDLRFQWRISRQGLTLITAYIPALHRTIEVSDTETTLALYRKFWRDKFGCEMRPNYDFSPEISPNDSCPVNTVTYDNAVAFCNWLDDHEGIGREEACYRATGDGRAPYEAVPGHRDLGGFRLPMNEEFDVYCAAGTKSRRYFGDSDSFLDRYAWIMTNSEGRTHPVATRMPNDLGVFDTFGNVTEWCESTRESTKVPAPGGPFAVDLRGGWYNWNPPRELELSTVILDQPRDDETKHLYFYGFRVVRTKQVHRNPGGSVSHDGPG